MRKYAEGIADLERLNKIESKGNLLLLHFERGHYA
jgi:hypothetical protein